MAKCAEDLTSNLQHLHKSTAACMPTTRVMYGRVETEESLGPSGYQNISRFRERPQESEEESNRGGHPNVLLWPVCTLMSRHTFIHTYAHTICTQHTKLSQTTSIL